jgi:hypothetical protein
MPERKVVATDLAGYMQPIRLREMLRFAEQELERRRDMRPRRKFGQAEADHDIRLAADIVDYLRRDLEAP